MTSLEDELSRALTRHVRWPAAVRWSVSDRERPPIVSVTGTLCRHRGRVGAEVPRAFAGLPGECQSNTDKEELGRPKRLRIKVVRIVCMDGDAEAELKWYRWR